MRLESKGTLRGVGATPNCGTYQQSILGEHAVIDGTVEVSGYRATPGIHRGLMSQTQCRAAACDPWCRGDSGPIATRKYQEGVCIGEARQRHEDARAKAPPLPRERLSMWMVSVGLTLASRQGVGDGALALPASTPRRRLRGQRRFRRSVDGGALRFEGHVELRPRIPRDTRVCGFLIARSLSRLIGVDDSLLPNIALNDGGVERCRAGCCDHPNTAPEWTGRLWPMRTSPTASI